MCRKASWILWVGVALLLPGAATAISQKHLRLTPAIDLRQEFNSNITYRERDAESDLVTAVTPTLELAYEGDRGHIKALAGLRSRSYWRNSELNALDQFGRVELERLVTRRLAVTASGRFDFYPNRDALEDGGSRELDGGRPDYFRQAFSGGFRYALDPLSILTVNAQFSDVDYDKGDGGSGFYRRDWQSRGVSVDYTRQLSERDEAGLSLSLSRDDFDEVPSVGTGEETNRTVSATLRWKRQWTPVWSSFLSAGARYVRLEEEGIPGLVVAPSSGFDTSPTDTSVGFVGGLELSRRTKRTVATVGYSKQTTPSSGYGSTVDSDTVSIGFTARLTDRLSLNAEAFAQQYESLGDSLGVGAPDGVKPYHDESLGLIFFPLCDRGEPGFLTTSSIQGVCVSLVDDEIDATVFGGHVQLGWRMNSHWRTFLRYTFRDQSSDGRRPVSEYTNHRVLMGFRYAIPIDLF